MALAASVIGGLLISAHAAAQEQVLNLYSARHYPTDKTYVQQFHQSHRHPHCAGAAYDAGILARLKAEGAVPNLILLVDAARLWRAEVDGLFRPVKSPALEAAIPANLRAKAVEGGTPCRLVHPVPGWWCTTNSASSARMWDTYEKLG